jgi:hypothetical protein
MAAMTTTLSGATRTAAADATPDRSGLAHLLVLVGIFSLTVWWVAWVTSQSILSEDRSNAIGAALVDDEVVKTEVSSQVLDGLRMAGVQALGFTNDDLQAAADAVAVDPAVESEIAQRVADAHRASLGIPTTPDGAGAFADQPFVDASIRALQEERPDIVIPNLQWLFTTSVGGGFPDLTGPAETVEGFRTPALLLAIAGIVGSAVLHPDRRPRRWLARWCLYAGAATLVLPVLVPMLTTSVGGDGGSTIRAVCAAIAGGPAQRGAVILLLIGGLLSLGTWAQRQRAEQQAEKQVDTTAIAVPAPPPEPTPLPTPAPLPRRQPRIEQPAAAPAPTPIPIAADRPALPKRRPTVPELPRRNAAR